jgi:ribosomal protein S12 methylthiotransferase accessory factor
LLPSVKDASGTPIASATRGDADNVLSLVSPYGVLAGVQEVLLPGGLQRMSLYRSLVGFSDRASGLDPASELGHGHAFDAPDHALLVALAEGAEIYSSVQLARRRQVTAAASELPGDALCPDEIPRCSDQEYANPDCPLVPFDGDARIRWTEGVDLLSGGPVWLPSVMACYRLASVSPAEMFWNSISTGCAVHSDPAEAVVHGICEVIERDAMAVLWLQRLALPPAVLERSSEQLEYLLDWSARHFIETFLFDATTDLGVPTVYCLQIAEHDRYARQVVGCATARTIMCAAEKALTEAVLVRGGLYSSDEIPSSYKDYASVWDGARYMAQPAQQSAFAFLVEHADRRTAPHRSALPDDPVQALATLIRILRAKRMRAVVVDRTSADLAEAGLTSVCVVIPGLQPMSLRPLAQYRGHPRLYSAAASMGYRVLSEDELNPWPQPFA